MLFPGRRSRGRESREAREERMWADHARTDWVSLAGHVSLEEQARRDRAAWEAGLGLVNIKADHVKPREKRIVSLKRSRRGQLNTYHEWAMMILLHGFDRDHPTTGKGVRSDYIDSLAEALKQAVDVWFDNRGKRSKSAQNAHPNS